MRAQFLKAVGLLFNFLVVFEANQEVTLRSNFPWAYKNSYRAFSMRTGWYDFSDVKSSKMLSFLSVAEAHGLIYPRPLDENFSFADQCFSSRRT